MEETEDEAGHLDDFEDEDCLETLLSEMILWKLFMKDLGAEIKEDSLPNVTSEI